MTNSEQPMEVLQDIRNMMKQSTRFLSLSGLSGVFAGVYALAGAWIGHSFIYTRIDYRSLTDEGYYRVVWITALICVAVLLLSVSTAMYLSARKARITGQSLFDHTALRLFIHLMVPLVAGGVLCIALLFHGDMVLLVAPVMLIFYGLALISASRHTLRDIGNLGYMELALGLIAAFFLGHGLLFWTIGFGFLHVIYGGYMWYKYDRNK